MLKTTSDLDEVPLFIRVVHHHNGDNYDVDGGLYWSICLTVYLPMSDWYGPKLGENAPKAPSGNLSSKTT